MRLMFLLSCLSIISVISQELNIRRDAQWPPPAITGPAHEPSQVCRKETGATDEMIQRFSDKDAHDHPDLKCYMKCLLLRMRAMDNNGNLNPGPALELLQRAEPWVQDILLKMGRKCLRIKYPKDVDLCEKAFLIQKCLKEADPVHYFLV